MRQRESFFLWSKNTICTLFCTLFDGEQGYGLESSGLAGSKGSGWSSPVASLRLRGSTFYIQFYQGGKQRRVNTDTDVLQIAKEKLRAFESAQARGDALPLATRTPIADIVTAYVEHIRLVKTGKSAQTDIYYLRDTFGPICDALKVTSRKISPLARKRPPKPGQDRRCKAPVIEYLDQMGTGIANQKKHLAAIRHFFDIAVTRHAVILNPAASVRGQRYQVVEGKTPMIGIDQARQLLESIEVRHVTGLRDRAIIATLIYTAARVSAVAKLDRSHFYDAGDQWYFRLFEKGGKSREIPVRHDLRGYVLDYLMAAGIFDDSGDAPLFRAAIARS